ncbi:FecR domain-containing protein [Maridesulfovibrio sp.]|uniref:FecR domain-containing protein n=1 Tax=Maridesulfovibrio sp. TaxID=2795000 RepID=UPI003BA9452D
MPSDINVIGVVTSATGDVHAVVNGELRLLETGSPVYQHDELVTGAGSSLEVRFQDDTLLSQGQESILSVSDYVFDSSDSSELLFEMARGTFRMVTGKIAEQNPERFKVGTPLATIGIRGTTTVHEINADGEKHGIEQVHSGKALVIQGADGSVRMIAASRELVDISSTGTLSSVRPMSVQEFVSFREIAPSAIRQEQEINEERMQDSQIEDSEQLNHLDIDDVTDEPGGGDIFRPDFAGEVDSDQSLLQTSHFTGDSSVKGVEPLSAGPSERLPIRPGEVPASGLLSIAAPPEPLDQEKENVSVEQQVEELILSESDNTDVPAPTEEDSNNVLPDPAAQSVIRGTNSSDNLKGSDIAQTFIGLDGNDVINAEGGNDLLLGAGGNDTLNGGYGNNILNGGDGIDFADFSFLDAATPVTVNLASFVADRNGEQDELRSIEGVITGTAADTLLGDDESNTFVYGGGRDVVKGYDGDDVLDLSSFDAESGFVISSLDSFAAIIGTDAHCSLESIEIVIGSNQGDTFDGDAGKDTFYGSSGNDILNGLGGDDRLFGDQGLDRLSGGTGSNYLDGGDGVDFADYTFLDAATSVTVNLKTFTADHCSDQDELHNIEGVITGGADDVLTGDDNANTFIYGGGNDFIDGGEGVDTLDLSKFSTASGYEVGLSDDYVRINGTSVQVDIENIECLIGSSHDDTMGGSTASETFYGGDGADNIHGSGNIDTIYGQGGDDNLEGGGGNDLLFGGIDNDFLMGGLGHDTLTGGAGADQFYFETPSSDECGDTITDFMSGEDKIKYSSTNFDPVNDLYKTSSYDGVSGDASGAQFVYDTTVNKLYYDADGSGIGESGVLIATFTNDADISDSDIESL